MDSGLGLLVTALKSTVGALVSMIQTLGVDLQRISKGVIVMGVGVLFVWLGVLLLFNHVLMATGNVLLVAGPVYIFDLERTYSFLCREGNRLASCCFLGGIILVLNRRLLIGMPLEIYGVYLLIYPYLPPDPFRYLIDVAMESLGIELEEHETTATSRFMWSSVLWSFGFPKLGLAGVIFGFAHLLYQSDHTWTYKLATSCVFAGGLFSFLAGWAVVGVPVMGFAHILLFSVFGRLIPYLRNVPVLGSMLSHLTSQQALEETQNSDTLEPSGNKVDSRP